MQRHTHTHTQYPQVQLYWTGIANFAAKWNLSPNHILANIQKRYLYMAPTHKHHRKSIYYIHIYLHANTSIYLQIYTYICMLNFYACTTGRFCLWTNTCWHILDTGNCYRISTHEHVLTCSMHNMRAPRTYVCIYVCMNYQVWETEASCINGWIADLSIQFMCVCISICACMYTYICSKVVVFIWVCRNRFVPSLSKKKRQEGKHNKKYFRVSLTFSLPFVVHCLLPICVVCFYSSAGRQGRLQGQTNRWPNVTTNCIAMQTNWLYVCGGVMRQSSKVMQFT